MIRGPIKYVIMFISLVLIQVLVLNQVQFSGFVNPYIYILFVMLLPLNAQKYTILILGFLMGFTIDIFSNSLGIHAAATTLIAFVRPAVIRTISDREEDRSEYPGLKQNSFRWFMYYTVIMVFIHHLAFFYLDVFSFADFWGTLYRVFLSSVFSIFIIVLSQYLIFRK
jgi:rod shape-determining protein MreD